METNTEVPFSHTHTLLRKDKRKFSSCLLLL